MLNDDLFDLYLKLNVVFQLTNRLKKISMTKQKQNILVMIVLLIISTQSMLAQSQISLNLDSLVFNNILIFKESMIIDSKLTIQACDSIGNVINFISPINKYYLLKYHNYSFVFDNGTGQKFKSLYIKMHYIKKRYTFLGVNYFRNKAVIQLDLINLEKVWSLSTIINRNAIPLKMIYF